MVASARLDEVVQWGHLVYLSNGPVLLIRAEEHRVLFGFWRGQRLREIVGRLKPGGKSELATVVRDGWRAWQPDARRSGARLREPGAPCGQFRHLRFPARRKPP